MRELAFISLGSNIEPQTHVPLAVARLAALGEIVAVSSVYENPAIGPTPQPDFLNAAVLLRTTLKPLALRRRLRQIEASLGRVRGADKYAPRTIDLDICVYGQCVVHAREVTLPAPELLEHAYLAATLAEIAPDHRHPVTHETFASLARRLARGARLKPRPDVRLDAPPVEPISERAPLIRRPRSGMHGR